MSGGDDNVPVAGSLPSEFSLIEKLFAPLAGEGSFALQDDAALFTPAPGRQLVLTKDAIAEGRHYLPDDPPGDVAQKLLRVNLSDLAAKGTTPQGYLLSCAWSTSISYAWMAAFAAGLAADQEHFGIVLLGGDTIRVDGPSVFSLTAIGDVAEGQMVLRSGANVGDDLWVTGTIGDGALGLLAAQGELDFLSPSEREHLIQRYRVPQPPVTFGRELSGIASAALDVSDGLVADLQHLCDRSAVTAVVERWNVPLSDPVKSAVKAHPELLDVVLGGGDDYQTLFSASQTAAAAIGQRMKMSGTRATKIGRLVETAAAPVLLELEPGEIVIAELRGFNHFE
jgi:thiamine-monophosphate kinase